MPRQPDETVDLDIYGSGSMPWSRALEALGTGSTSALRITSRRTGSMVVMISVSSRCQWRWVRSATSAPVAWERMVQPAGK